MPLQPEVSVSIDIDAPPDVVWNLASDVTRMGDWSPECTGGRWKRGAAGPVPGARFKGRNRRGFRRWSTDGRIVAATPGREVAWETSILGLRSSRWSYRIEPQGDGRNSHVIESWQYHGSRFLLFAARLVSGVADRPTHNAAGMRSTLERVKAAAEAGRFSAGTAPR